MRQHRTSHELTFAVLPIGVQFISDPAGALVAAARVDADVLTAVSLPRTLVQLWGRGEGEVRGGGVRVRMD